MWTSLWLYPVLLLVVPLTNIGRCNDEQRQQVFCRESNQNCSTNIDELDVEWGNCLSVLIISQCRANPLCMVDSMSCMLNFTAFLEQLN